MKLYFAPLEGITTATYRNTHKQMFEGADAYFAPFVNPSEQEKISKKGMRDILPERNEGINLKIQILTNNAESFLRFVEKIKLMGYDEININLGCPASTVVRKGRGAGFLQYPELIDNFLCEIFERSDIKISLKTRTGYSSGEEMERLLGIYNKYPASLLIVHPRTREEFYKGEPDMDVFKKVYGGSVNKLCYNGNIFSAADYERINSEFPNLDSVMIGRGAIANPAIFREIKGGKRINTAEIIEFSQRLMHNYNEILDSDTFTLHKLKEVWVYMISNYPDEKKIAKAIKKASKLSDFSAALQCLPEL